MDTYKNHIYLLVKSIPKVSELAIIRKLKQETKNLVCGTKKEYLIKDCWKVHTLWSDGYFASFLTTLAKKQSKITYATRVEVNDFYPTTATLMRVEEGVFPS
jgi:REP element-mobilizing transposase RayT